METLLALESPLPDEDGQGTIDLFWPWQTVDLSDTRHWIIDHLRNDLINQQRIAVLEFCADQRHFAPSVLSVEALAAIAHNIIEICQEWEWL